MVTEAADGTFYLQTRCRCGRDLELPVGRKRPAAMVKALARAVLCDECAVDDAERAERAEREAKFAARLKASGAPNVEPPEWEGFDRTTPDGLDRGRVIDAARDWAKMADPGGLCLIGEVGCGKTALATRAVLERLRFDGVRWVSLARLAAELGNWGTDERQAAVKVLTGRGALVIDDFDKGNVTDWLASQLFTAIDGRINAKAPLLLTTNLTPEQMTEKFGDAITSRVVGYCRVLELAGPDYRLA